MLSVMWRSTIRLTSSIHCQLMNEETADHRVQSKQKMSSHVTREKIVNSCKERLSRCQQDFEESLSALHQETDHLGPDHCCSCGTCPASPPSWNSTTSATVSTAVITSVIPLDPLNGNASNADSAVMDSNVDLPCLCSCCTDSDEPKHSSQWIGICLFCIRVNVQSNYIWNFEGFLPIWKSICNISFVLSPCCGVLLSLSQAQYLFIFRLVSFDQIIEKMYTISPRLRARFI